MEKKPPSGSSKPRQSSTSVTGNKSSRRSMSKSPVRPKSPKSKNGLETTENEINANSNAPRPTTPGTSQGKTTNKAKSTANAGGGGVQQNQLISTKAATPSKKSATNVVPGTSEVTPAKKNNVNVDYHHVVNSTGTTSMAKSAERVPTAAAHPNPNPDNVATMYSTSPPTSKMSTNARAGSQVPGASTGGGIALYRNLNQYQNPSTNISRPIPRPSNFISRSSLAKSAVTLSRGQNSAIFRASVEKAMREHKIFTIVGVYPAVRNALKRRGWVEKNFNTHLALKTNQAGLRIGGEFSSEAPRGSEEESDQAWLVRVLKEYPPDFIWVIRRDNIEWRLLHKEQIINRYPKAFFTTKTGIAACLQNIHWYSEPGVAEILFPRCYRLCLDEEKLAFVEDFRITACFSLLKLFVAIYERDGETGFRDLNSRMNAVNIEFAMRQVMNYMRMRRHEDIDWLMPPPLSGSHWEAFLSSYYEIAQGRQKFNWKETTPAENLRAKVEQIRKINSRAAIFWPQYHIDGCNSLWICKPGARSRGKGIIILSQLDKIMDLLSNTNFREANWVVQKYIEKPLLIYKTKFDIRQWFIITDWTPLTIWFYKESYIRFCTKPFTLVDFHESVHLCNNAVQCRYKNSELRDTALPDENMWDCYTFQAYLNTIGKMDTWDKIIYSGMKQAIIGVLLASQETVDNRKNCFELYGADFMLSEDMKPWLIEINSCPCMASSTSVTARLCPSCLEDTIKVILDRRDDKYCDTGYFEMIYKQNVTGLQTTLYGGNDLILQGRKMSRDIDWPGIMTKYNSKRASASPNTGALTPRPRDPKQDLDGVTFVSLVERLRLRDVEHDTTPHAQKSVDAQSSSLQYAIQKYRLGQASHPPQGVKETDSDQTPSGPTPILDSTGILKVRKLHTGPPDPVILYNGLPGNQQFPNMGNRSGPGVSYSEMYPLYTHLSNKQPQMFGSFGNRSVQNKSVYGNGLNANITATPGGAINPNSTQRKTANRSMSSKSNNYAYPTAPLSLLTGHPTPVAATMADLLRISNNAGGTSPSSVYGHLTNLTDQRGQGKQQQGPPTMLINPMKSKSLKIKPGPSNRSSNASPMRVSNPGNNNTSTSDAKSSESTPSPNPNKSWF